ncbi:hypothetical protein WAA20_18690 [Butyrivibrio fibrisolvens]|uniref:hypothetical protein n=1 Tax=Butyrivibrio fibrisolvens TaxID=831 RepID=UPI001430BA83|nr:hypothetical protein [Butyrivibrio fibrisolvens]
MYDRRSRNRIQYIEDTNINSLLKLEFLNMIKDFIVTEAIYCPKKKPIMHSAIYERVSTGDKDIYFHFMKWDKYTKIAMQDK